MKRLVLAAAAALALALLATPIVQRALAQAGGGSPVVPFGANDFGHITLNILPAGQKGVFDAAEALQAQAAFQGGETCYVDQPGIDFPPYTIDQSCMYQALIQGEPGLTEAQLLDGQTYFKDATFGVPPGKVSREYQPDALNRPGLVVQRDIDFDVPRVYGTTRSDTLFGAGYVSAEDRLFAMDILRHVGRGRLSEFLGASSSNLAQDRGTYRVSGYNEDDLQFILDNLVNDVAEPGLGAQIQQDFADFTAGVNKYIQDALTAQAKLPADYAALQKTPQPWLPTDTIAVAGLIGAELGVGGGGELSNANFALALEAAFPALSDAQRKAIFEDLQHDDDPEAPTKVTTSFPYLQQTVPVDPSKVAIPDPGSLAAVMRGIMMAERPAVVDGPLGPVRLATPSATSNALLVGKGRSATGFPLAVFGPQTGYWSPEILVELELHGPGIDARGAAFPGISGYVLLGRGADHAWSATSAGSDQVDVVAEVLCEPDESPPTVDSRHYVYAGQCIPMYVREDSWITQPTAGGVPDPNFPDDLIPGFPEGLPDLENDPFFLIDDADPLNIVVTALVLRTAHGIVQTTGLVNGQPVAYVRQRATFFHEVEGAVPFIKLNDPEGVTDADSFRTAMVELPFTFNWFYIDRDDIAYQLSGDYPIRAADVDYDLPYFASTANDWQGWDAQCWLDAVADAQTPETRQNWDPRCWNADYLGRDDVPHGVNPPHGYLTSWNNKQAPGWNAADNNLGYTSLHRVLPLIDRLDADPSMTPVKLTQAMAQAATVDLRGDKVVPVLLQVLDPTGQIAQGLASSGNLNADAGIQVLAAWNAAGAHRRDMNLDGVYEDAAAVALMDAWWSDLIRTVFSVLTNPVIDSVPLQFHDEPGPVGSAFISGWYGPVEKDLRGALAATPVAPYSRIYCGASDVSLGGNLNDCRSDLIASLGAAVVGLGGPVPALWDADEEGDRIQYSSLGVIFLPSDQWQNRPTFQQVVEYRLDASDADDDGITNDLDNCPLVANPLQEDADADVAYGDVCECGDANLDGFVSDADRQLVQDSQIGLATLPPGSLCDTNNDGNCTTHDASRISGFVLAQLVKSDLVCVEKVGPIVP